MSKKSNSNILILIICTVSITMLVCFGFLAIYNSINGVTSNVIKVDSSNVAIESIFEATTLSMSLIYNILVITTAFLTVILILFSLMQYYKSKEIKELKDEVASEREEIIDSMKELEEYKKSVEVDIHYLKYEKSSVMFELMLFDKFNIDLHAIKEIVEERYLIISKYRIILNKVSDEMLFYLYILKGIFEINDANYDGARIFFETSVLYCTNVNQRSYLMFNMFLLCKKEKNESEATKYVRKSVDLLLNQDEEMNNKEILLSSLIKQLLYNDFPKEDVAFYIKKINGRGLRYNFEHLLKTSYHNGRIQIEYIDRLEKMENYYKEIEKDIFS